MTPVDPAETIELRVGNMDQLFHTLDPFPFRERDLDREAEEYRQYVPEPASQDSSG